MRRVGSDRLGVQPAERGVAALDPIEHGAEDLGDEAGADEDDRREQQTGDRAGDGGGDLHHHSGEELDEPLAPGTRVGEPSQDETEPLVDEYQAQEPGGDPDEPLHQGEEPLPVHELRAAHLQLAGMGLRQAGQAPDQEHPEPGAAPRGARRGSSWPAGRRAAPCRAGSGRGSRGSRRRWSGPPGPPSQRRPPRPRPGGRPGRRGRGRTPSTRRWSPPGRSGSRWPRPGALRGGRGVPQSGRGPARPGPRGRRPAGEPGTWRRAG